MSDPVPGWASHENPVWRSQANFIVISDLSECGMPGRWEQVWARRVAEAQFQVCCIPFFPYSYALGDTVSAGPKGPHRWVVSGILSRSGHRTARFAVQPREAATRIHEELHAIVVASGLEHEWHGSGYLAVDLPPERDPESLTVAFAEYLDAGHLVAELVG